MKKFIFYIFSMVLLISFNSCFLFKNNTKKETESNYKKDVQQFIDSIKNNELNFSTLSSGFSIEYSNNDSKFFTKGSLRIKKETFIWISIRPALGVELGRILFTKDSIKYIDRLKKEYFVENYSYIEKKFGFFLDYQNIEAILTNRIFLYPQNNTIQNYILVKKEDKNSLISKGNTEENYFTHSIQFSDQNTIVSQELIKKAGKITIHINYSDFMVLEQKSFPFKIETIYLDGNKKNNINFSYKTIKINKEIQENFKISKNYKRIKFE